MANSDYEAEYRDPPLLTAEDTEDRLIALASQRAMERLQDGTASNQLVAEILKHGTAVARLQREKLQKENELLRARTEAIKSEKRSEEFYNKVIKAIYSYGPQFYNNQSEDEEDEYDE